VNGFEQCLKGLVTSFPADIKEKAEMISVYDSNYWVEKRKIAALLNYQRLSDSLGWGTRPTYDKIS